MDCELKIRKVRQHLVVFASELVEQDELPKSRESDPVSMMIRNVKEYRIILLGPDGKINEGAYVHTEYRENEVRGRTLDFLLAESKQDLVKKLSGSRRCQEYLHLLCKSAPKTFVKLILASVKNNEDMLIGYSAMICDIRSEKQKRKFENAPDAYMTIDLDDMKSLNAIKQQRLYSDAPGSKLSGKTILDVSAERQPDSSLTLDRLKDLPCSKLQNDPTFHNESLSLERY